MSGIKRTSTDDIFSKAVRAAADWTCEHCNRYYPEGSRAGLHCSHLFSRRHVRTRHLAGNAFAHCYSCHKKLGGNPWDFAKWAEDTLGVGFIEILREKAHTPLKLPRKERQQRDKELRAHWRAEFERVEALRAEGVQGKIELIEYE